MIQVLYVLCEHISISAFNTHTYDNITTYPTRVGGRASTVKKHKKRFR
jgi:hypothetical protein